MDFEKELQFYIKNKQKFVSQYNGKVLVLRNESIEGVFDNTEQAYDFGKEKFGLGNFAIQPVSDNPESHAAVFHSPGIVAI